MYCSVELCTLITHLLITHLGLPIRDFRDSTYHCSEKNPFVMNPFFAPDSSVSESLCDILGIL